MQINKSEKTFRAGENLGKEKTLTINAFALRTLSPPPLLGLMNLTTNPARNKHPSVAMYATAG